MAPPKTTLAIELQFEDLNILLDMQQPSPDSSIANNVSNFRDFSTISNSKSDILRKRRTVQKTAVRFQSWLGCQIIPTGKLRHHQKPQEPVMGIEPMTPVLPRLCATAAPHGQVANVRWAVRDSNPRSRQTADLQSAPFGHFGNCPGREPPTSRDTTLAQAHTSLKQANRERPR